MMSSVDVAFDQFYVQVASLSFLYTLLEMFLNKNDQNIATALNPNQDITLKMNHAWSISKLQSVL